MSREGSGDDRPLVTVVTVVLNDAAGFRQTALSIIGQRGVRWAWVVVDGGSTDDTIGVIRSVEGSIARWISEPDRGVYDAMNKGIAAATGDYVLFMNAGDRFADETSLARLGNAIGAGPAGPAMVFGGAISRYPSGIEVHCPPRRIEHCIWHRAPASHQATLTRADLHKAELFDPRFKVCADYAVICRFVRRQERFAYVDEIVAVVAHGGRSVSHRHAWRRVGEVMRIQRQILGSRPAWIILSVLKRCASIAAEHALSLRLAGSWRPVRDTDRTGRRLERSQLADLAKTRYVSGSSEAPHTPDRHK